MANLNVNMDIAPSYGNWQNHRQAYEKTVELAAGGSSPAIIIPQDVTNISISLVYTGGGTGSVEVSNDSVYTVKEGTPTWISQAVVGGTNVLINIAPPTAIRATQVNAGTMKMAVRAQ
jgi:predicted Rossmann-fold nucleotide-binding protein